MQIYQVAKYVFFSNQMKLQEQSLVLIITLFLGNYEIIVIDLNFS